MAGGGVGEAMLIGAAVGAGTGAGMSAIQKKDPLEGAIVGALGGAATGGLGSALGSGATSAVQSAATETAAQELGKEALNQGIQSTLASNAGQTATSALTSSAPTAAQSGIGQMMGQSTQAAFSGAPINAASYLGPGGSSIPGIGSATSGGAPILSSGQYSSYGTLLGTSPQSGAALNAGVTQPATGGFSDAAKWMAGGKGTGFAPSLTNAQAYGAGAGGGIGGILSAGAQGNQWAPEAETYSGPLSQFNYDPRKYQAAGYGRVGYAEGGITDLDVGRREAYTRGATEPVTMFASGGISDLGSYSDGGRLTRGPGDGMSDDIPARIGARQPARLADGEFVVPADVVSHLGNGSTDAGAKQLYSMMDKVRTARTGQKRQGREINPRKYMPV